MRPARGKVITIVILILGLLGAAGAQWHRARERAAAAADLGDPRLRAMAFSRLLRSNGLWGTMRECAFDERANGPGRAYARTRAGGAVVRQVIRGVRRDEDGGLRTAAFVFSADGKVEAVYDDAWPVLLNDAQDETAGIIVKEAPGNDVRSVFVVKAKAEEALRVRGNFVIAEPDAATNLEAPGGAAATFRFDPDAACFRGPAGGPDKPWEVDRARSPGYCP